MNFSKVNYELKRPPYDKFPVISDNNIILREIRRTDIKDIIEISFYDAKKAETFEQAAEMQARINQDYNEGNSIHWGIINKSTQEIVGTCGYYRGFDKGIGELGCILLPQYSGKGLMTNAMKLAIDFGFEIIRLKQIIAITTVNNHKAINLLKRLGFKKAADLPNDQMRFERYL